MNVRMKERFQRDIAFIIDNIAKDGAKPSIQALERSLACFEVSFEDGRASPGADLISFKYVAAALCMREIEQCSGGRG
jgi:hypothetical protein